MAIALTPAEAYVAERSTIPIQELQESSPPPRKYGYSFRGLPFPEFSNMFALWSTLPAGSYTVLPGSKGCTSTYDLAYYRRHVKTHALLHGLVIGLDYGLQIDPREQCIKVLKLR